jgi:hypothetical protein
MTASFITIKPSAFGYLSNIFGRTLHTKQESTGKASHVWSPLLRTQAPKIALKITGCLVNPATAGLT